MQTADARRVDPFKNFRFKVEIHGMIQAGFSECSGLSSKVAAIEYREGGDHKRVYKLPGQTSYSDITLKWGLTNSNELYDWHIKAFNGHVDRKNGSVVILGDDEEEVARWDFTQAWPTSWTGPTLNAKDNMVAIETLVLVCETIIRSK